MKLEKTRKRYCPRCKKHTLQKVTISKRRQNVHPLGSSGKIRRHFGKGYGNLGTHGSKPALTKFKMANKKATKKTDFRYTCPVCNKTTMQKAGFRAKKIEFK